MVFNYNDAVKIIHQYFELIDSIYGSSIHDIGNGDGISKLNAEEIVKVYSKYSGDYFTMINNNYRNPSKNIIEIIKETI